MNDVNYDNQNQIDFYIGKLDFYLYYEQEKIGSEIFSNLIGYLKRSINFESYFDDKSKNMYDLYKSLNKEFLSYHRIYSFKQKSNYFKNEQDFKELLQKLQSNVNGKLYYYINNELAFVDDSTNNSFEMSKKL